MAISALLIVLASGAQAPPVDWENVPNLLNECLVASPRDVRPSRRLNPFYLSGDFDGDRRADYALLIQDRATEKDGILLCLTSRVKRPVVLGAGTRVAMEGGVSVDDLAGFDVWSVARLPTGSVDSLFIEWTEKGSGYFTLVNGQIVWRQGAI